MHSSTPDSTRTLRNQPLPRKRARTIDPETDTNGQISKRPTASGSDIQDWLQQIPSKKLDVSTKFSPQPSDHDRESKRRQSEVAVTSPAQLFTGEALGQLEQANKTLLQSDMDEQSALSFTSDSSGTINAYNSKFETEL